MRFREGIMADRKGRWARHNDIDTDLVNRATVGEKTPPLGTRERVAAVHRLAQQGLKDRDIAARLWWWRDSGSGATAVGVFRHRHGIAPGVPCTRSPGRRAA